MTALTKINKDSIAAEQTFNLALDSLKDPLLGTVFSNIVNIGYLGLADIYHRRKIYDIAEEYFNKILDMNPPSFLKAITLLNRGQNRLDNSNVSGSMQDLYIATAYSHTSAFAHTNMGKLYIRLGLHELAETELTKAIQTDPNLAPAYYNLGVLYNDEGNTSRAKSLFSTSIEMDRDAIM